MTPAKQIVPQRLIDGADGTQIVHLAFVAPVNAGES